MPRFTTDKKILVKLLTDQQKKWATRGHELVNIADPNNIENVSMEVLLEGLQEMIKIDKLFNRSSDFISLLNKLNDEKFPINENGIIETPIDLKGLEPLNIIAEFEALGIKLYKGDA